jgi:hypothetical protein
MQQFRTRVGAGVGALLLLLGLASASAIAPDLSVGTVNAQQAPFVCTEVIGFSVTESWYNGGFIGSTPNPGNWQLRWFSGGSIDQWAAGAGFPGWNAEYLVTRCNQSSDRPDRVVLQVSGQYNSDPNWWAQQTGYAINNIRNRYPSERQIVLMPIIGGPGGGACYDSSGNINRATYNFPYINQGLRMNVGGEVILGPAETVRSCAEYKDNVGHLTPDAARAAGIRIAQWFASGSGGSVPAPSTATPTSTPRAASTATRTPTPATAPVGTQAINFDDVSGNRPLSGQYPSNLIDWGTGAWWLSGPYGRFTTNSVSFDGTTPRSATFRFTSPRRPVQIDAFNGGSAYSTVTLACNGTLVNQMSLGPNQLTTLPSGIVGTCSTVTLGSTNGWDVNFDNLLIDGGSGSAAATPVPAATNTAIATATATATRTPTRVPPTNTPAPPTNTSVPAATATRTPTAVPTSPAAGPASQTMMTFDDLPGPNRVLSGRYGAAEWGNGAWWLAEPYAGFSTQSVSFNGGTLRAASIDLPTPVRLMSIDVTNGGPATTSVSIACAGQPTVQVEVLPRETRSIRTDWTGLCVRITFGSTNGWDTNFDNFAFSGTAPSSGPTSTPVAGATPAPTSPPASTTAAQTVTFDDLSNPYRELNGQYPAGLIDWGTGTWYLSGRYYQFASNSVSFNGDGPTSAALRIPTPRVVTAVDVMNGGSAATTIGLSCAGQPPLQRSVAR